MDAAGSYTAGPPTRKLQKAPEINTLTALPTFVISRSGVRIRPPAPSSNEARCTPLPPRRRKLCIRSLRFPFPRRPAVLGSARRNERDKKVHMGEFPSGQRGQTVNLLAMPSMVRIHLPPPNQVECLLSLVFYYPALAGVAVGLVLHFAGKRAADA